MVRFSGRVGQERAPAGPLKPKRGVSNGSSFFVAELAILASLAELAALASLASLAELAVLAILAILAELAACR